MMQTDEKIPVESPWAYMNRTAPLALDFGSEGVQTGEPEAEPERYGGLNVESVRGVEPIGTPVEMTPEQRERTFRRDWTKMKGAVQREPYVAPVPAPPRVKCRDAFENEMPVEMWQLLCALTPQQPRMLLLRATYAQAGEERLLKQTGRCAKCSAVAAVNADGSLRSHAKPKPESNCSGSGLAPMVLADGKGTCRQCDVVKPVTKKGVMPAHKEPTEKCAVDSTGEEETGNAYVLLPPTTLPPIQTVVLRAVWSKQEYAFGCYEWDDNAAEWTFNLGIIRGDETNSATLSVGIKAWRAFVAARIEQASAPVQMILEL